MSQDDIEREKVIAILKEIGRRDPNRLAKVMVDLLADRVRPLGQALAELSPLGNIAAYGGKSCSPEEPGQERWAVVLCTQDAADALTAWIKEQSRERLAAAKADGNTHISHAASPNWSPQSTTTPRDPSPN